MRTPRRAGSEAGSRRWPTARWDFAARSPSAIPTATRCAWSRPEGPASLHVGERRDGHGDVRALALRRHVARVERGDRVVRDERAGLWPRAARAAFDEVLDLR